MIKRNLNLDKLAKNYLFSEINKRKEAFLKDNPQAELISLGIGDTTEPLPEAIVKGMMHAAVDLGVRELYSGYGPDQGLLELRKKISEVFYSGRISPEEIFISDGAKCDVGRLQVLFGSDIKVGIQDPAYPVYIDGSALQGVSHITLVPCTPDNEFFPDLENVDVDLLYICSPNNPTGTVLNRTQLEKLVKYAKTTQTLILFDAAYSAFIKDDSLPKSIYEIEGASEVAIEVNSFSKFAGFTGVRLGWTVVPKMLKYKTGEPVWPDYYRVNSTLFNGASILSQKAGLAALSDKGLEEVYEKITLYQENAAFLKAALLEMGFEVYGSDNAPYLWVSIGNMSSWEAFEFLLNHANIITTPGSGFGKEGEGFVRFSAFASREDVLVAKERLLELSKNSKLSMLTEA